MGSVLVIGAGGVGNVVVRKCAAVPDVFERLCLASRTVSKCERIAADLPRPIETAQVNADDPAQVAALIRKFKPDLVLNVALPYQDLPIMDACLETGVDYLDTANYEPRDEAKFEYKWQWAYHDRFREKGIMALLGSGFDPGVTNIFCAHAQKHHFDEIHTIDIFDCNAGDHGHPFATNFNPEINIREVSANGRYWADGQWVQTAPMEIKHTFDFPEGIGPRDAYLLHHEEMESLGKQYPEIRRMRFWMTFSPSYLTHLRVLENVGMTRIDPVVYEGREIVPLRFLQALLPDPGSLGPRTTGKTCIGCWVRGEKDGRPRAYYVYNVCDHRECFREVGSQAVSYTTGVPAAVGAKMLLSGQWSGPGVFNLEQFDPDPFLATLAEWGLPWTETFPPYEQTW